MKRQRKERCKKHEERYAPAELVGGDASATYSRRVNRVWTRRDNRDKAARIIEVWKGTVTCGRQPC